MTGKEALDLLFCTSEGLPEDKVYECKKILGKELEYLTKYKRAFEILKDRLMLKMYEEEYLYKPLYTLESNEGVRLTKEEYELLEELMKSE